MDEVPGGGSQGPGDTRWGRSGGRARLTGVLLALAVLMTASALILPSGAVRLFVMAFISLPAVFFLMSRPRHVLAILLFVMFSNLDIFLPMRLFRPLVLFLMVCVLASWLDGRKIIIRDRTLIILMAAFYLIAFQSMAFAQDFPRAADRLESLTGVYVVVLMALILVDSEKRFLFMLAVLAAATLLSDFLPFLIPPPDYYSSRTLIWDVGVLRYEGYRLEANFFAFYQTFIIPVLLFFFAKYARPRVARPLILAVIAGSMFVMMLSFSRGGFVSLVVIILCLLVMERGNRAVAVAGLVALALLTVVTPALYWDRIVSLFEAAKNVSEDYAILVRVKTMKVAMILGSRNPLFGVGIDNFIGQAARFVPYTKVVHNAFLQAFSELGVFGLAVLMAIFVRNIRILWGMITGRPGGEESRAGMFLMVQQVAVGVNAMFVPSAYDPVLWLTLALPSIARQIYRPSPAKLNSREI